MKIIRIGIGTIAAFEVLAFGGEGPSAVAVLEIGSAILLLAWGILAIRRRYAEVHSNWLYLPLFGFGLLGVIQNTFHFSAYPYLTSAELLKGSAYLVLCFLMVESFTSAGDRNQFSWFLLSFGFLVSFFAIVQHFTSNGSLYWSFPLHAGGSPFGPYVNRDDFACLIELVAPIGLALLFFQAMRKELFPLALLFTAVSVGALCLSASRAGVAALLLELLLLAVLSRPPRITRREIAGLAALSFVAGAFIAWLGVTKVVQRFELLTPANLSQDLRVPIYRDTWRIFVTHPLLGTGLGTFAAVFPRYATFYLPGMIVDHAHSDYLELLAETGSVGGICGLAFLILLLWRGFRNVRSAQTRSSRAVHAGCLAACSGVLLQSLVDFNLQIPANALIFLLLACLAAVSGEGERRLLIKNRGGERSVGQANRPCYRDISSGGLPASQGFSQKSSDSQSP